MTLSRELVDIFIASLPLARVAPLLPNGHANAMRYTKDLTKLKDYVNSLIVVFRAVALRGE